MSGAKKFSMIEVLATVVTVVLVVEAAAPVAAIGNSQVFFWIVLTITFLMPYGLIASELGTTYPSEGGMIDWIDCALGHRWASRSAWYYWINFPIWMASLAVMIPLILQFIVGIEFATMPSLIIELIFIWVVVFMGMSKASERAWVFNAVAIVKILLAVGIGILGIYVGVTMGFANDMSARSFLPSGLDTLQYLPVILFNFLGFEVVCTFVESMDNPSKQIPTAIIAGGLLIVAIYIFASFGIGAAIPVDQISSDVGIMDAIVVIAGDAAWLVIAVGILFIVALLGNMISWAMGVCNAAAYAADQGEMPKVFAKRNEEGVPVGASIVNGVVATVIVLIAPFIPNQDLFWSFFSLNLFAFIVSYLPMFPSFLKLREIDPDTERPYKVPFKGALLKVMAWLPFVQIAICAVLITVPLAFDAETLAATLPITIGALIIVAVIEAYVRIKNIPSDRRSVEALTEAAE